MKMVDDFGRELIADYGNRKYAYEDYWIVCRHPEGYHSCTALTKPMPFAEACNKCEEIKLSDAKSPSGDVFRVYRIYKVMERRQSGDGKRGSGKTRP